MSFIHRLRERLVAERELHDLSRDRELAGFPLFGYRTTGVSADFVALCEADRLTERQVVELRDEFFDAVQQVSLDDWVRPRVGQTNGLLVFVFREGCSERMERFIRSQSRVSHGAASGAVTVSWAVDLAHRRVHTHANPVSVLPPVIVVPQTVYPGREWLESMVHTWASDAAPQEPAPRESAPAGPVVPASSTAPPPKAPPPASAERTRILFLGANSTSAAMDLEREVSRIQQDLRAAHARDTFEFRHVGAVTIQTLLQALVDEAPTIVHFAGHGTTGGILLRDDAGNPKLVTGEALAGLFELFPGDVKCVVLNACWSETTARAIRSHVPYVVGTRAAIQDSAALAFSAGFYKAIAAGWDVPRAFRMGKTSIQLEGGGGEDIPVLL